MALMHARRELAVGDPFKHYSLLGIELAVVASDSSDCETLTRAYISSGLPARQARDG
jgi:proline racemase